MIRNAQYWANWIRQVNIPDFQAFSECLERRILPTFSMIDDEASRVADETHERLGMVATEYTDPGDVADHARDAGLRYFETMKGVEQAVVNLFTAACYHLFEQQLLLIYRQEWRGFGRTDQGKPVGLQDVRGGFSDEGIDLDRLEAWDTIDELRLVANVVKHAEGRSADELRQRNPRLFIHSDPLLDKMLGERRRPGRWLYQPLIGEDFYVGIDDYHRYVMGDVVD